MRLLRTSQNDIFLWRRIFQTDGRKSYTTVIECQTHPYSLREYGPISIALHWNMTLWRRWYRSTYGDALWSPIETVSPSMVFPYKPKETHCADQCRRISNIISNTKDLRFKSLLIILIKGEGWVLVAVEGRMATWLRSPRAWRKAMAGNGYSHRYRALHRVHILLWTCVIECIALFRNEKCNEIAWKVCQEQTMVKYRPVSNIIGFGMKLYEDHSFVVIPLGIETSDYKHIHGSNIYI